MSEEELIETLRAFEKNRVEQLEEPAKNLFYAIMKIADERDRLNNIIKRLEEFIEKEIELYTLELTEKNTNALSYSLPIRGVYKEIYNVLQELKGSDKE